MKLWAVILGSFWLGGLALMSFMFAAFAGGGMTNAGVSARVMTFLDASLLVLPALSVLAVVMIWVAYVNHWGEIHYWWNAFPLPFIAGYVAVLFWMGK